MSIKWDTLKTAEDFEEERLQAELENFRNERNKLISESIVTTSTGKSFHADEPSIIKLSNCVIKNINQPDDYIIRWSTADVGTGIMVECTKSEIVEAHQLAVEYVESVWELPQE